MTGSPIVASGRMQLSVELIPFESMSLFSDAKHAVIPFVWIEEGSGIQGKELAGLRFMDGFLSGFAYARFVFMILGIFMLGTGAAMSKGWNPKKLKSKGGEVEGDDDTPAYGSSFTYS